MEPDLITRRENAMDLADRALDEAWPERKGADYVHEMRSAANEIEKIAEEMQSEGVEPVEQSRTYRYLGSVYSDLAPALGREMFIKAKEAYELSEAFLEGYDDELEWAKLNFNFGNTLRQIDPNDIGQLQEAQERFVAARKVFAKQAPQFLEQVDSALMSVRSLLKIAPMAMAIENNYAEMEALKKQLASGENLSEIIAKIRNVMTKDGGLAGLIGKIQTLTSELPEELRESDKFSEIQHKLNSLAEFAINETGDREVPNYVYENAQFTVYRPKAIAPLKWYPLLAFAHLSERRLDASDDEPDPLEEVERQAKKLLDELIEEYQDLTQDSEYFIPQGGKISFVPEIAGIDFNPARRTFRWKEDVHCEQFRIRASPDLDGQKARGRITVYFGVIIVAEIYLNIKVDSRYKKLRESLSTKRSQGRYYRKLFPSYHRQDLPIVQQVSDYAHGLGDTYLADLTHIRSGEVWEQKIEELIEEADVFQLFWSRNSMNSPFVKKEYQYALSLGRPNFLRPCYWENPFPEDKVSGLPPHELKKLHFQRLSVPKQEEQILNMLRKRLEAELKQGKVTSDRAETLGGVVEQLGSILSADGDNPNELLERGQRLRELIGTQFESQHYLSHGLDRPAAGSRASELVEICWSLRRYLLEEMNRSGKGPDESKEALRLNIQAAKVDKRIYEAGENTDRAVTVDKEELRPLSLAVRSFSARLHPMIAQPIWPTATVPVDVSAVFYSGSADLRRRVMKICNRLGLSLMSAPRGESIANARWKQLQKAMLTIFDLAVKQGSACAAVAYELGIALTLGKPLVVMSTKERPLPFNVDVDAVILSGDSDDDDKMSSAIDQSIVWTYSRGPKKAFLATLDHVLKKYPRPQSDTYLDQTLKLMSDQREEPDPLTVNRTLKKFVDFLEDDTTILIHPVWNPKYPELDRPRLFHVMPFRPEWADDAVMVTRRMCETRGADYVRGDKVEDPNVIRSIWQEIARASHALVDLTGFNANVALELGIIHTLGRKSLLVGQGDTVERLFPMIAKLRVHAYRDIEELGELVRAFLK